MFKTPLRRLLVFTALLTLVAPLLLWRMPDNVGLGAMVYIVADALISAAAGITLLTVALFGRWLPRTTGWGLAAFAAWVVLPIIAGPVLGVALLSGLLNYYWSDGYAQFNADRLGVTIELQDQDFEFANCRISAYTATYHIEAQRMQHLTFGLDSGDDIWFFERGGLPAQSIGEQFQRVGESDVAWSMDIGLYEIPQGSHTLVVRGAKPFLLEIYDPAPLWTPDLILAGNKHNAMLYDEDFSRADIEAMAQPYLPASCPPLGCKPGDTQREPPATPVAEADSAAIGAVVAEQAIASGQGSQYAALELDVTLDVTTTGNYMLKGTLMPAGRGPGAWARYTSMAEGPLCPGTHTVKLHFRGDDIRDAGVDGPYTVSLALEYDSPTASYPPTVDEVDDPYTTAAYAANQFGDAMQGSLRTAERTPDRDGNGLYDQLAVEVFFDLPEPVNFEWLGSLVGAGGCLAGNAAGTGRLDAETPATFTVTGGRIRSSRCDGPYTLTDVFINPTREDAEAGWSFTTLWDVHTTQAYATGQFDTTPIAFDAFSIERPDPDNNDRFDRLLIHTTVAAIDRDTQDQYNWAGSLLAPDGTVIETVGGRSQLYPGKTITFDFSGAAIAEAGLDGPYTLGDVTITSETAQGLTATLPVLYTIPNLRADNFAP